MLLLLFQLLFLGIIWVNLILVHCMRQWKRDFIIFIHSTCALYVQCSTRGAGTITGSGTDVAPLRLIWKACNLSKKHINQTALYLLYCTVLYDFAHHIGNYSHQLRKCSVGCTVSDAISMTSEMCWSYSSLSILTESESIHFLSYYQSDLNWFDPFWKQDTLIAYHAFATH